MSVSQQVLDDLNQALAIDRERSFEAGRLAERDSLSELREAAYRHGVLDERARVFDALRKLGSGGDFFEARWNEIKEIFDPEK